MFECLEIREIGLKKKLDWGDNGIMKSNKELKKKCVCVWERERERESRIWEGIGERIIENSREKDQENASLFTSEIRVTSWVFIQWLAPILLVVHSTHVPQPIAMLRNHAWSINQEIGSFIVASAWDQIRQHYPKVE